MNKIIVSENEALESYKKGKTVFFGNDVLNAWFDTDGYSFERTDASFKNIINSFDEKNGIDTLKPIQYAIVQ
ncbi:hypothetical protein ACOTWR_06450 [Aliarcobacter butzleri]